MLRGSALLDGQPGTGVWALFVRDDTPMNSGRLAHWGITFCSQGGAGTATATATATPTPAPRRTSTPTPASPLLDHRPIPANQGMWRGAMAR